MSVDSLDQFCRRCHARIGAVSTHDGTWTVDSRPIISDENGKYIVCPDPDCGEVTPLTEITAGVWVPAR